MNQFSFNNSPLIENIIKQIIEIAKPLSVYLFGSTVRGENTKNSDLDFLIVVPENIHKRKMAQKLYKAVDSQLVPCDFIITTKSIIEKHKENSYMVYSYALKEGVLLYEQ